MPSDSTAIAMPISIAEIQAHPAEAIAALVETVRRQEVEITHLQDNFGIAMSLIAKLKNNRTKTDGKKMSARLSTVEYLLIANGNEALSFSEVGKRLELGSREGSKTTRRQNMTILGKALESDSRFIVFESSTQKGRKMVRLDGGYFEGKSM